MKFYTHHVLNIMEFDWLERFTMNEISEIMNYFLNLFMCKCIKEQVRIKVGNNTEYDTLPLTDMGLDNIQHCLHPQCLSSGRQPQFCQYLKYLLHSLPLTTDASPSLQFSPYCWNACMVVTD